MRGCGGTITSIENYPMAVFKLLIILVAGLFLVGIGTAAIVLLVVFLRGKKPGGELSPDSQLRAETQRLKDEIASLRRKPE